MPTVATKLKGEQCLTIYLAIDDVKALDKFRTEEGLPSRSAAVAELMRRGLAIRPAT
jgi:metal-responsive CopG/Arc/MetJ family transcriptional regulator